MEQISRLKSRVDKKHDLVKTNVLIMVDHKKGKKFAFADQLLLQAATNPRNLGKSSRQTHTMNHNHVDEEAV